MVSRADYDALIEDRPRKFTPADVDFRPDKGEGYPCASCVHWFYSPMRDRAVCEIVRPENEQIPVDWTCRFHTIDGINFPKLEAA